MSSVDKAKVRKIEFAPPTRLFSPCPSFPLFAFRILQSWTILKVQVQRTERSTFVRYNYERLHNTEMPRTTPFQMTDILCHVKSKGTRGAAGEEGEEIFVYWWVTREPLLQRMREMEECAQLGDAKHLLQTTRYTITMLPQIYIIIYIGYSLSK